MAEKTKQSTLTSLLVDLVAEILCRLAVKKLIQCRRVCKSWNSLISHDSNFVNHHLRFSTLTQVRRRLPTLNSTILRSTDAIVSKYKLQFGKYESSCDGMLCYSMHGKSIALLFNPFIRKSKILPQLEFPDNRFCNRFYTLVYHRLINNYKVVAINTYTLQREVNVYTFGTNCWTRIQDFPTLDKLSFEKSSTFTFISKGIFINDSVNWLTERGTERSIVSLDLEKELYQKISLPVYDVIHFVSLERLRGCLSLLFHFHAWVIFPTCVDVWIMKEFGNEKSWIKLLSVPYLKEWGPYCRYIKVIHISEDDHVLMLIGMPEKNRLVVYDSINKIFNFPEFLSKTDLPMEPEVYVESLISPL